MKKPFYQEDIIEICDNKHLTAEEIFFLLKKKYSSIGKATIYRNLEELVKQGYLNKLTSVGSKAKFEKNKGFHAHVYDEKTGELYDIDLDMKKLGLNLPNNFEMKRVEVVIKGGFEK